MPGRARRYVSRPEVLPPWGSRESCPVLHDRPGPPGPGAWRRPTGGVRARRRPGRRAGLAVDGHRQPLARALVAPDASCGPRPPPPPPTRRSRPQWRSDGSLPRSVGAPPRPTGQEPRPATTAGHGRRQRPTTPHEPGTRTRHRQTKQPTPRAQTPADGAAAHQDADRGPPVTRPPDHRQPAPRGSQQAGRCTKMGSRARLLPTMTGFVTAIISRAAPPSPPTAQTRSVYNT